MRSSQEQRSQNKLPGDIVQANVSSWHLADMDPTSENVRFWHLADIDADPEHVRS